MNLKFFLTFNYFSLFGNRHRFVAQAISLVFCLVLIFFQAHIKLPDYKTSIVHVDEKVSAPFIKFAASGYTLTAVDWMWIRTLQIVGESVHPPEMIPLVVRFYDVATDLDPRFMELYEQGGVFLSFYFHAHDQSVQILQKGIQYYENNITEWQNPYSIYLLSAYVYAYELNNWTKAKEVYLKAAAIPGAPEYLQNMIKWLKNKGSEKTLAVRVLKMLIITTRDPLLKSQYQEKLKQYD